MATKKTTRKAPPSITIPERFRSDREEHKYVAKFKKSWEKRFKPTRMDELFEAVDLGIFLVALGRHEEAIDLLSYTTGLVDFSGDQNIWGPTGYGIICLCWQYRIRGEEALRQQQLARIKEHGFINCENDAFLNGFVTEHPEQMQKAASETQKWGCHILSRDLMGLTFLRETVDEGFAHSGKFDANELDGLIAEALDALRTKLK